MDKLEDKPPVTGIMANWLQSNSESKEITSKDKPAAKKKGEKNSIMTNWLKRARNDSDNVDKPCDEKNIKLC